MITPPVYNDAAFREQFPAFSSTTAYSAVALQFAWTMGANWVDQTYSACWGIGTNATKWQQAADLMGAIVVYQLYGPASGGLQQPSEAGEAPGPVTAAAEGSVNASFQIPDVGDSAFASLCYSSPPYGRMLLALLQISASVGPYISSRRPSYIPP